MSVPPLKVIYPHAGGRGWDSVTLMARLAGRLLGGEVVELSGFPGRARKALGVLPRRRSGGDCLLIAPEPMSLSFLLGADHLIRGHRRVVAWVIDSFWDDRIPHVARHRGHIDHLFITDRELVGAWQSRTGVPTGWLPFGANVLEHGTAGGERPFDLQIIGRQPAGWADRDAVAAAAGEVGVTIAPPIPYIDGDPEANQAALRAGMARSKFTLAFSNLAAPASYTHPTRDYLTGRWTEALCVGSTVAGIRPGCEAASVTLWPEATLELGTTDMPTGLSIVREAAQQWRPESAATQQVMALRRLDWRWRFAELAAALGRPAPALERELAELTTRLEVLTA